MKFLNAAKFTAISGIATLALAGCAANEMLAAQTNNNAGQTAKLSGELNGVGASSMGSAQEAWIAAFQTANPRVTINYDPQGSGTGRETFQHGASAFAGSDRPFKKDEIAGGLFAGCVADAGIVEFPAYISPIAIIFNVTGVDSLKLDAATIAQIFSGKITRWNDPAIVAQNAGVNLPDANITAVHRSDKSGATGNFTDYLAGAAPEHWTAGTVEEWPSQFGGEAAQGTSGVVAAVTNGTNTIGYVDASRAGNLGTVAVKVGNEYVTYSPEAAAKIVDSSPVEEGRSANDLAIKLKRDSVEAGVYPIVMISYAIACGQYQDSAQGTLAKAYLGYIASAAGQNLAAEAAGSAPLSPNLQNKIAKIIANIK